MKNLFTTAFKTLTILHPANPILGLVHNEKFLQLSRSNSPRIRSRALLRGLRARNNRVRDDASPSAR